MNGTVDMLKIIHMTGPKGRIPDGMKVTAIMGPDNNQPQRNGPVLAVGGFTLWPMSYTDNRVSFGMVMYDPKWNIVQSIEKPGARYIYNITKDAAGTVTFIGQANHSVKMSLADICQMMCHK